ncbi:MAG: hypothetical protein IPH12_12745 [Saprospirales bacterium]|nr:hypothetical protein [Saprospirales bacterium]
MKVFDRIAVVGCKATTLFLLDNLNLPYPVRFLVTIAPEAGQKHDVADYLDLKSAAEARGIQVYQARYYSLKHPDDLAFIHSLQIDIAFVMGWQRLIPAEVLERPIDRRVRDAWKFDEPPAWPGKVADELVHYRRPASLLYQLVPLRSGGRFWRYRRYV